MGDNNLPVPIRVIRINEKIAELKDDFAAFIVDKSRPLEQRWEVFKKANDALSKHSQYIIRIPCLGESFFEHWFDGDNKIPDTNMVDFIETLEDQSWEDNIDLFHIPEETAIEDVKEWILEKNLKSFSYDW